MRDIYWWAPHRPDVGLLGTTAQLGLPSDEEILTASNGLVVSTRGSAFANDVVLLVREFATGSITRQIPTNIDASDARLLGTRLFWTGLIPGSSCDTDLADGGVWTVDLAGAAEPIAVVPPGTPIGICQSGRSLLVSPSGDTVGALMSSYGDGNWIDVIDAKTLDHHRLSHVWPAAITDDTFIQWDVAPTDGIALGDGGVTAYSLDRGKARWGFPGDPDVKYFAPGQFVALGSQFYVEYTWATESSNELRLAAFDPLTGKRRGLLEQPMAPEDRLGHLRGVLSVPSHLTLEVGDDPEDAGPQSYGLLETKSGSVTWDAFVIDPPWVCFHPYCLRG